MREKSYDSERESSDFELGSETEEKSQKEEQVLKNKELIKAISKTLTLILDENMKMSNYDEIVKKQSKNKFSTNKEPKISVYDYLVRIQTYSHIEKNTLIISLIYIDKLCHKNNIFLTYYNVHRILFSAIIMAIKYNEDAFYDNKYYSEIAGLSLNELKVLEFTFIKLCDFNLFVHDDIFENYSTYLHSFEKNNLLSEIN
jgi:hypothetical protein